MCLLAAVDRASEHLTASSCLLSSSSSSAAAAASNGLHNKLDELWNFAASSLSTSTVTTQDAGLNSGVTLLQSRTSSFSSLSSVGPSIVTASDMALNSEMTRLRNRTLSSSSAGHGVYSVASCFLDKDELSDVETIYSVQVFGFCLLVNFVSRMTSCCVCFSY